MNILLLSRYGRLGASSRVRYYQFIPALEALGHTVTTSAFLPDTYLRRLYQGGRPRPDVVAGAYFRRIRRLLTSGTVFSCSSSSLRLRFIYIHIYILLKLNKYLVIFFLIFFIT